MPKVERWDTCEVALRSPDGISNPFAVVSLTAAFRHETRQKAR